MWSMRRIWAKGSGWLRDMQDLNIFLTTCSGFKVTAELINAASSSDSLCWKSLESENLTLWWLPLQGCVMKTWQKTGNEEVGGWDLDQDRGMLVVFVGLETSTEFVLFLFLATKMSLGHFTRQGEFYGLSIWGLPQKLLSLADSRDRSAKEAKTFSAPTSSTETLYALSHFNLKPKKRKEKQKAKYSYL